jgi:hypothetical protein
MQQNTYHIYAHSDSDGGIAAAIFAKFIHEKYAKYDWNIEITPVNHVTSQGEWQYKEISWPCAILDFTLHPALLSDRFFNKKWDLEKNNTSKKEIPECYWIDHHPTGAFFSFFSEENIHQISRDIIVKWDTRAISTPGLLRTHHEELGIAKRLIREYEEYIDIAEIIDGALYATCEAAHDFSLPPVKLQTLFNPSHPCIDRTALYKKISRYIWQNPSIEDLFDSDPIYASLIRYEEQEHNKQLRAYRKVTQMKGQVAVANFYNHSEYEGLGRFIPYLLFPNASYALHIIPKTKGTFAISCGINPWNKPVGPEKHLGNFFSRYFSGGGHAFVAGGKLDTKDWTKIENLISFLNS